MTMSCPPATRAHHPQWAPLHGNPISPISPFKVSYRMRELENLTKILKTLSPGLFTMPRS